MGIKVSWYTADQAVLLMHFEGAWSLEDLFDASEARCRMMESVAHDVDLVADLTKSVSVPQGVLSTLPAIAASRPPNHRFSVVVGTQNALIRTFANLFSAVYRQLLYANSVEEAAALLLARKIAA
jgi:hypothetical protein